MSDPNWQPRIVAFFCNWCTYTAADLAGVSRLKYAANVRVIRLMCSGRVDPQFILDALARGADGVLIGGCHLGDCHYVEGNYKTLRRFQMLKRLLRDMGIEDQRVRLEWISAAEGERVKTVINEMVEQVRALGPLSLPQAARDWDREMTPLAGAAGKSELAEQRAEPEAAHALNPKSPSTGAPRAAAARKPSWIWPRTSSAWSRRWTLSSGRWRWISRTRTSRRCRTSPSSPRCSTARSAPPSRRRWRDLLRRKSQFLIAYGACAVSGGIPGLANQFPREQILQVQLTRTRRRW